MATRSISRVFSRSLTVKSHSFHPSTTSRLRPIAAVVDTFRQISPATAIVRGFSTRQTTSSIRDSSPNFTNRPPKETILLDGCDFEHWLVVVEPPKGDSTRDDIIDDYIKTLASVVGSEDEARMKIYSISTKHYFAFGALVSEELSYKLKELSNVRWVLPDSYLDVKNKNYGGEPFINGQALPYDPKYHEEWVRNHARANDRNKRNDRPRNSDRSRNFERRDNMRQQNRMGGPPGNMGGGPPGSMGGGPPGNMGGGPPGNMGGGGPHGRGGAPNMGAMQQNMGAMPQNNMGAMQQNNVGGVANMGQMHNGNMGQMRNDNMGQMHNGNMGQMPLGQMRNDNMGQMRNDNTGQMHNGNMGQMRDDNMGQLQHGNMGNMGGPSQNMGGMAPNNMRAPNRQMENFEQRNMPNNGGNTYQSGPATNRGYQNTYSPNTSGGNSYQTQDIPESNMPRSNYQ